jgi:hypothetical protein|tara:strand:+ start:1639 stop:2544 length:906 start_codon:yes stop_codon:yes gene_type:complete
MLDLPSLRREYGPVFVTTLENGSVIPWKQLSIGEYLEYSALLEGETYARVTIEDEVFRKCVLDELTIINLPGLKAGTVTTVVQDILRNSGPNTIEELNLSLNIYRNVATQAVHQTAVLVAQAFPAYTLEQIYEMNFNDFMMRVAQAESKLMQLGILEEPINFLDPTAQVEIETPETPKMDAMEMYRMYEKQQGKSEPKQTIIKNTQMFSNSGLSDEESGYTANDLDESTQVIFKDYIDQLNSGQDLRIKTPEERLAEAKVREEQGKKIVGQQVNTRQVENEALEEQYAEILKRASAKKKNR